MAYLRKSPHSRFWQMQWVSRNSDGKRVWRVRSTGQTNYDKAMEYVKIFEAAKKRRIERDRINSIVQAAGMRQIFIEVNLEDLWEWYISHCEVTGNERTKKDKQNVLIRFVEWCKKVHPEIERVRDLTLHIVSEFWVSLANDGKSASTRNNTLSALCSIWSEIQAPMELEINPWKTIKRDNGVSVKYQPFTLEELELLRQTAREYKSSIEIESNFWEIAIEIGFCTGLRVGDIATLEWEEIPIESDYLVLKPNKTKHWDSDRVTVHSLLMPWVKMLPQRQDSGYIFPLAAKMYECQKLSSDFSKLALKAGIKLDREPEKGERRQRKVKLKCFHSLRHTFATIMLESGISEEELVNQGNWNGKEVINHHYNHAKLELAKKSANKIAEIMQKVTPLENARSIEG